MKKDQATYELIEKYLQGQLEGEALVDFEKQLESDEELRAELAVQRELHSLLGDAEVNELDAKLDVLSKEFAEAKEVKFRPGRIIWLATAAVLVLAVAYLGFFQNQQLSGSERFEAYYETYPADVISRADPDAMSLVDSALSLYGNGSYEVASGLLAEVSEPDARVKFYQGLCLLNMSEDERALEQLTAAALDDNSVYQVPAKWYASLLLLKMEQEAEAIELLQVISKSASGKYQNLANDLLSELK